VSSRLQVLAIFLAAAALAGCATSSGRSGAASAAMAADGSIELRVKPAGLFGRRDVVTIRPGEPGYEGMRAGIDAVGGPARKPRLSWTIGEPTWLP
jgi:hypothetical protein